jgi:hypothetical protein
MGMVKGCRGIMPAATVLAVAMFAVSTITVAQEQSEIDLATKIRAYIVVIEAETDVNIRERLATGLARTVRSGDRSEVDDETIDRIAELLEDEDAAIRQYAAITISHFGLRASKAIPALRSVVERAEFEHALELARLKENADEATYPGFPIFSGNVWLNDVCYALDVLGDTSPPVNCRDGFYVGDS